MASTQKRNFATEADLKYYIVLMLTDIQRGSEKAVLNGYRGVNAWGARIKALDAIVGARFKNHAEYQAERNKFKKRLLTAHKQDATSIFNIYLDWFGNICYELAWLNIYPDNPVEEEIFVEEEQE